MISDQWDVVRVPFPFTDKAASKKRPALVLSKAAFNSASGHTIMAMITKRENNSWPADYDVQQWSQAGLRIPSWIRMKFFTIENTLIVDKLGVLQPIDIAGFRTVASPVIW
jgi:mRNA interferase MazF